MPPIRGSAPTSADAHTMQASTFLPIAQAHVATERALLGVRRGARRSVRLEVMMRMGIRTLLWTTAGALALAIALAPAPASAFGGGTPDTDPPAEEVACDGLGGRMWGLCVAYCEAQDCPASEHPSCDVLRSKLYDLTGSEEFPCDGSGGGGGGGGIG